MPSRKKVVDCRSKVGESVALIDAAIAVLRQASRSMQAAPEVSDALMDFYSDKEVRAVFQAAQNRTFYRFRKLKARSEPDFVDDLSPDELKEFHGLCVLMSNNNYGPDVWQNESYDLIMESSSLFKEQQERAELLEAALKRLGSMEAFHLGRMIDTAHDKELLARIEYARDIAAKST